LHAQDAYLAMNDESQTVREVFGEIESTSNYIFFYLDNSLDLDRRVSVKVSGEQVEKVLDQIFAGTNNRYHISERQIIVSQIPTPAPAARQTQQGRSISGVVRDSSGPVVGAYVSVQGTSQGVITGSAGEFSIQGVAPGAVLQVSFLGYVTREIAVGSQTSVTITLEEDAQVLDELVVIGYGTAKRSDLTGSVSSVSSRDIEKRPVTNLASALQGQVPGVVISSVSGAPGEGLKIRVRGANSVIGDNDPLYVVDGVVLSIGTNELNVGDIESVEILKDASATAIYGSRGANGVVMITTKRGGIEQPTAIRFTANVGVNMLPKRYDLLDAGQFAELTTIYRPGYFTDDQIAAYKRNGGVDWQDQIFQAGVTQNYDVGVYGGSAKTTFYISGNYIDQTGIVKNSSMSRYTFRSNLSTQVGNRLKVDLNMTAGRSKGLNTGDRGGKGSVVWLASIFAPTFNIREEDGSWHRNDNLTGPNYANPAMTLTERHSDWLRNTMSANTKFSLSIVDGLQLDVLFGVDNISTQSGNISNTWINQTNTTASLSERKNYTWQNSNILTYAKTFADVHDLTVMVANEQSSTLSSAFNANGTAIEPISVGYDNLGLASTQTIGSSRSQFLLQSWFGRVAYSFNDRYLLTATFRADGTSKFQGKNKWGYFPSAAFAWRVSEESFMQGVDAISNLKFRASWGVTGNQGVNPYATIAVVANNPYAYGQDTRFPGTSYSGADNPNLKWETTAQTNVGIDIGFLNGGLRLSADYYYKKTSDLLLGVTIPAYDGGGRVNRNVGDVQNNGFEVILGATPFRRAIRWDVNANFSAHRNKILNLGDETFILNSGTPAAGMFQASPFALQVGESLGSFYGYRWEGIYKTSEAAEAEVYGFVPGDNKYKDLNNDKKLDTNDQEMIGSALPKFTWGFDNTLTWKNLSLNIMLQGVHGNKMINTMYASATTILSDATAISHVDGLDYWTPQREGARFANPTTSTGKNHIASTQFLEDASFVKVKNLGLSYNFEKAKTGFADIKLTVSAQNILTFTKYSGFDPETSTTSSDVDGAVDLGAYPNPKIVTFGIQMTF
jgi:TonB-linked SusC/RagA family outer membrane protein